MKLEIRDLTFGYGKKVVGCKLNINVDEGQSLCILGSNGVGKTTLLKTVLGILKPMEGEILIDGISTGGWSPAEFGKAIAYVPQQHIPPFPFSVLDVVLMGRTVHMSTFGMPKKQDRDIACDILRKMGIDDLKDKSYTEISGGERQMVLISRALAQKPQILILDEPTSNLDFGNQARVLEYIIKLVEEGLTVVMTSHRPEHALAAASKVVLMKGGDAIDYGPPENVITEESMKSLYGIDVVMVDADMPNRRKAKLCIPLMNSYN